ncbi:MAG: hypothetical protein J5873_05190 [Bacteroidales bacterium]|nr:hypothetical protein [Bacteroidales bacterium]
MSLKPFLFATLAALALALPACEDLFWEEEMQGTPTETFDFLWNKVDRQYAFFDVKQVDWQQVYDSLRPKVSDDISDDSLFHLMGRMLNTLNDGHANLISPFDLSYSDAVYRKMEQQKNVDKQVVNLHYLHIADDHYHKTGGIAHHELRNGTIAYWSYSSFEGKADSATLSYLTQHYAQAKGIVLDLRQNKGGYIANVWNLLNLLPNDGQVLYRTQIKSGAGHEAFGPLKEVRAPKRSVSYGNYQKPVMVLVDRGSYSATSFFALCTKAYAHVQLIGDTTGGGLGLPNGGQLPNGWIYRFSLTRTLSPKGMNYENGVPPDHYLRLDPKATAQGKDNLIEYACDLIENQTSMEAASRK